MKAIIKAILAALRATKGAGLKSFASIAAAARRAWLGIVALVVAFKDDLKKAARDIADSFGATAAEAGVRKALGPDAPSEVIVNALEICATNRVAAQAFALRKRAELEGHKQVMKVSADSAIDLLLENMTQVGPELPAGVKAKLRETLVRNFDSLRGSATNGVNSILEKAAAKTDAQFAGLQGRLQAALTNAQLRETRVGIVGSGTGRTANDALRHRSTAQLRALLRNIDEGDAVTHWTAAEIRAELVRREEKRNK